MALRGERNRAQDGPPAVMPEGNPPRASSDHSWTLQAVMEMKKDLGVLIERIDHLRSDVAGLSGKISEVDSKVDKINTKLIWVTGFTVGVVAIVGIVWTIVTQIPWEKIVTAREPVAASAKK